MRHPPLPLDGGCRCGKVRIRISAPPLLTMACHCAGCQRMSSGPYSLSAAIPTEGFEVTLGAPVIGGLHGEAKHHFCGWCMSWLFTRMDALPWFVNLRPTMLDETGWFSPFIETWMSEKLPWAATPAVHSFETLPSPDAFDGLIAAYAEWAKGG